jgi:hypothetical protein
MPRTKCRPNIMSVFYLTSVLLIACFAFFEKSVSQTMPVPVNIQYALFMKILSFDRALDDRVHGEIIIGIVYERNSKKSSDVMNNLIVAMDEAPADVMGMHVRYVLMDIADEPDMSRLVARHGPSVLYVAPIGATNIEAIASVCRTKKILTLTGIPEYLESGLAVGVGVNEKRPQVIINLAAARAEGTNFDSRLLRVAKVIQ